MKPDPPSDQAAHLPAADHHHRTELVTLVFTDIVGSTALKQQLGDKAGAALIQQHHALVREVRQEFADSQEIETAGDSFLLLFTRPSAAVRFALRLQARLRKPLVAGDGDPVTLQDRIGIHLGEIVIAEHQHGLKPRDLYGIQVDTCARLMSLASGGQILMTRAVFDNARQSLKGEEMAGVESLNWLNHGSYRLKGLDEPVEVCEVRTGEAGPVKPPTSSEKAERLTVEGEPVLGWRPAVGQAVPNTQWVLEKKLGEGGFGEVWLGRHEKLKERRVFKFCFRADRVRSLKREMTLFRVLKERMGDHPNIVRLLEVYFEEPPFYVMMDHVEGEDLKTWCEQQGGADKIPLPVKLEIVAHMADALQAAHDAGVIHRDVKPGNILVSGQRSVASDQKASGHAPLAPRPSSLLAKLTDFGIGQVVSEEVLKGVTKSGFTQTMVADSSSSHTGSQLYMAPELFAGKPASTRSDIYSLGVVLYQLMVGDFARPVATDWGKQVEDPLLREDLALCFAGEPQDRFAGAGQLAKNLRTWDQRRQEFLARERMQKQTALRRRIALGSAGVAGLLLLLAIALGYGLRQARSVTRDLRQRSYASDMKAAQVAIQQDNRGLAMSLLQRHYPKLGEEDLRGIEWRYLWQECRSDELQNFPHPGMVPTAVLSPDGHCLATTDLDGNTRVWELTSGRLVREFDGKPIVGGLLKTLGFSPDGRSLALIGKDGIEIRDTANWSVLRELKAARPPLSFSPDGRWLGAMGTNGLVIWNPATWTHRVLTNFQASANNLSFAPDGKLVACSTYGMIQLWDLENGRHSHLEAPRHNAWSVLISPDAKWLASGNWDGEVCLWDLAQRQLVIRLQAHRAHVYALAFSPDGRILVTGGGDQLIHLWEAGTTNRLATLQGHVNEVWSLEVSNDGRKLASSSKDGTAKLWSMNSGRGKSQTFDLTTNFVLIGALSDGSALVTADRKARTTQLWSATGGQLIRSFVWTEFEQQGCTQFGYFPAQDSVVGVSTNGRVFFWSLRTGERTRSVPMGGAQFEPVGLSRESRWLLGRSSDWSVGLYDLNNARSFQAWPIFDVFLTAFSPDSRWLAYSTTNFNLKIWDLAAHRQTTTLRGHKWSISALRFSPDSRLLASGSADADVRLWLTRSGKLLFPPLQGHQSSVTHIGFSSDGKTLMTGSDDSTIRWWNVATGQEMLLFRDVRAWGASLLVERDSGDAFFFRQERSDSIRFTTLPSLAEIDAAEKPAATGPRR